MSTKIVKTVSDIAQAHPRIKVVMQSLLDEYLISSETTKHSFSPQLRNTKDVKNEYAQIHLVRSGIQNSAKNLEKLTNQEQHFKRTLDDVSNKLPEEEFISVVLKLLQDTYKNYYIDLKQYSSKQIKQIQKFVYLILCLASVGTIALFGGSIFLLNKYPLFGTTSTIIGIFCGITSLLAFKYYKKLVSQLDEMNRETNEFMNFWSATYYINDISNKKRKKEVTENVLNRFASQKYDSKKARVNVTV